MKNVLWLLFLIATFNSYAQSSPQLVHDIKANGNQSSKPSWLSVLNNNLIFFAEDSLHGRELWKYDGNTTQSLGFDLSFGVGDAGTDVLNCTGATINNEFYFPANDGTDTFYLYKWNGTTAPKKIKQIGPWNTYKWTKRSNAYSAHLRDGNALVQLGNYLYSLGGWNPYLTPITDSEVYRAHVNDLSNWTRLPDAPWRGRHTFGAGVIKDSLYVWLGDFIYGKYQNDVWVATSDINGNLSWSKKSDSVPCGQRAIMGTCVHNNELYVVGGQKGYAYSNGAYGDVWKSTNGVNWIKLVDTLSEVKKNLSGSLTSFNNKLYVVSGGIYNSPSSANTYDTGVYCSADGGTNWKQSADIPFRTRQYPNTVAFDNKLFTFFGVNRAPSGFSQNLSDIWYLDTAEHWHLASINDIPARHAAGITQFTDTNGTEHVAIAAGNFWNDVWEGTNTNRFPVQPVALNNILYFTAFDSTNGGELWSYNPALDTMARLFNPAQDSSIENIRNLTIYNNKIYFSAFSDLLGEEVWYYDPATDRVSLACDINKGIFSSKPHDFCVHGSKLYFSASTKISGNELYGLDKANNVSLLSDLAAGIKDGVQAYGDCGKCIVGYNDRVFFWGNNGDGDMELWAYDTVSSQMNLISNINTAGQDTGRGFITYGGKLYFAAHDAIQGNELFCYTDTTNVVMVPDIDIKGSLNPHNFCVYNNALYFTAFLQSTGYELFSLVDTNNSIAVKKLPSRLQSIKIYPNPVSSSITIETWNTKPQSYHYVISNIEGKIVLTERLAFTLGNCLQTVDIRNFVPGIYLIKVYDGSGNNIYTEKFEKIID